MLDDESLLKSFLKKQKEIQDKFLTDLVGQQISVDTKELKTLVESHKGALNRAENLRPNIDTSGIQTATSLAINNAVENTRLTKIVNAVDAQTRAIERNNLILQQGTGRMFKWWLMLLIALFFFGVGWGVNWYFEIPQQVVGAHKYTKVAAAYDRLNNAMANDCTLAKRYYKDIGAEWDGSHCNHTDENGNLINALPLQTSDEITNGN